MRFGSVLFSSVNATEASVFGYSAFTHFVQPLTIRKGNKILPDISKNQKKLHAQEKCVACLEKINIAFWLNKSRFVPIEIKSFL